ncbi:MAG: hypothetical protein EKK31_12075 [Hyphomicrobiales bacterium]|nr:MAG: hypothetical protein EKK31_12075 [Hyphomicrobiales bacterium]
MQATRSIDGCAPGYPDGTRSDGTAIPAVRPGVLLIRHRDRIKAAARPGAAQRFMESQTRSSSLFLKQFRTENRYALFLELL